MKQGVTTEVCGNCGFSAFPFLPGRQRDVRRHVGVLLGPQAYSDLPAWSEAVERQGFYSNLVSLVGHGSLRAGVFGFERRAPRSDDLDDMVSLAQAALEHGAAGLSSRPHLHPRCVCGDDGDRGAVQQGRSPEPGARTRPTCAVRRT